ncbi:site-specific DNA-methyltransferase [Synergistales bacterium]|nr:site-specific DNA-methyltransferase [Synergistales bacterium]
MDKLKMQTADLAAANFATLAALFPNAITETIDENGIVVRAIDADVLSQEINTRVVSGKEERYQFTWPDKKKSVLLANAPIAATLRPCRAESVDFDNTENLYIEGDNLDVLKLLQETYLNRVKMIYIDPPYNTGNDFIYEDDFAEDAGEFLSRDRQYDEDGNRLVRNLDSNGRFHTDWLNMIYPRLRLARDLLRDDGIIFISIDDNEVAQLRKICDEIFGASNFAAELIWQRAFSPKNDSKYTSNDHDYVLCYAKSLVNFNIGRLPRTEEANARYKNNDNDPRGGWTSGDLSVKTYSAEYDYSIKTPSGREVAPPHGSCWRVSKEKFAELVADNRIWFGEDGDNVPRLKRFLSDVQDNMVASSLMLFQDAGHSQEGRQELKKLFDDKGYFDGPKPVRLLRRLLMLGNVQDNDIVLDFFSGSATTAHAVMQLNAKDGGKRKFIMVQIPEVCAPDSEAAKAGYANICEIGKERIRRAGAKIKADSPLTTTDLDTGFRVLKLDSSNMKDVYYTPQDTVQLNLDGLIENIKEDRTPEDLLFSVMLDLGILLSSKIETRKIGGVTVFFVNDNYLTACFERVTDEIITEIAQAKPYYAVFRDSSFASDSTLVNFEQVFKTYSPTTIRRVL